MSNFFDHRYYRLNKLYMSQYGIWPEQPLILRCLLPVVFTFTLVSIIVPEVIRMHDVRQDIDRVIEGIPPIMVMIVSLAKVYNGCINVGKMREVINRISRDWKYLEGTRVYIYGSMTLFLIVPVIPSILDVVVPLNESRPKKALYEAEYGVNPDDYFFEILFHSYLTTVATIGVLVTVDSMYFVNVQHACALFKVVGANLKISLDGDYSNEEDHFKTIRYCMNLHKDALSFADLLESAYSTCFAVVIFIYLVTMSISGVLVVIKLGQTDDMIRFGSFTVAVALSLFLNSVPGQNLIDHSLDVHTVAYDFEWYEMSAKLQRLVVPMMLKSAKPCVLTAGKIYIISMENYSSVMQSAMSYFTVFSSMR